MNYRYFERAFICGQTQNGKTHFVKHAILAKLARFIVYDAVKREYGDYGVIVEDIEGFAEAMRRNIPKIIIQPKENQRSMELFDRFCGLIFKYYRHGTFIVDESHNYCNPNFIPGGLADILTMGEGEQFRIGFVGITQLPATINPQLIAQAKHKISFYIDEENARKKLYYSGFSNYAHDLGKLPPFHYFYFCGPERVYRFCKPI